MIHDGKFLNATLIKLCVENSEERMADTSEGRLCPGGPLYKGMPGWSLGRWRYWELRFDVLSELVGAEGEGQCA